MKRVIIFGALIVVAFIVVLQFIPLGIEPLTEVYFENHTLLRANSFPEEEYNFSFTIHNLEYQDMAYNYNISRYDVDEAFIELLAEDRAYLGDNKSITIFQEFVLPKGFDRTRLLIEVEKDHLNRTPDFKKKLWWPDPNYPNKIEIHFWTDEIVPVSVTYT